MKKLIIMALVITVSLAMASCGSSRKTGCPAVAQSSNPLSLKA
jgi:hypothetical protein